VSWNFKISEKEGHLLIYLRGRGEHEHLLRCNQAVVDRLNITYSKVIGSSLADVLKTDQHFDNPLYAFNWLGRVYDVSIFPMQEEVPPKKKLIVFHDITDRKQAEATR
jgi:hypothetical protein